MMLSDFNLHLLSTVRVSNKLYSVQGLRSEHLLQCCLHESHSRTAALYNISWLAWANDTTVHYVAIHYPR